MRMEHLKKKQSGTSYDDSNNCHKIKYFQNFTPLAMYLEAQHP